MRIILALISSRVSLVMLSAKASPFSLHGTKWKKCSIGSRSGLLGGIWIRNKSQLQVHIALFASLLFCDGSPSCNHSLLPFLLALTSNKLKCFSMNFAKKVPVRWSYDSQRIIATKNLTSVLPVPSLRPFAVQPNDNPSPGFLQILA